MKIETHPDSEKQSQMLKLLQFGTVMVFVDSRHPDVDVPEHLKGDFQLRLNFDYAYELDDFRVLPDRLEATLSFDKDEHFCVIPFNAVYLFVSHSVQHGILFTQSVPIEMLEYFAAEAQKQQEQDALEAKPKFNVVSGGSASVETSSPAKSESKPKRGHLRVVK